jgi:hypothetical protein
MQAVARPFFSHACSLAVRVFFFPALMQQLELAINIFHGRQNFSCPPIFSSGGRQIYFGKWGHKWLVVLL